MWGDLLLLSVIGSHAREDVSTIVHRKGQDIAKVGYTFWLYHSSAASPEAVQRLCREARERNDQPACLFISAASTRGARPTTTTQPATSYSDDNHRWHRLPSELSPVTGKLRALCLVLGQLTEQKERVEVNLAEFSNFLAPDMPIQPGLGRSTLCAVRAKEPHPGKSRPRKVIAVGRLVEPFAVWVR